MGVLGVFFRWLTWNGSGFNQGKRNQRGFTGHEHLDEFKLIHMNGRLYDQDLGRFFGVDPFIQFPSNSQSLNPYAYLMNNPLSGTDPTGYESCAAVKVDQTNTSGTCELAGQRLSYSFNAEGDVGVAAGPNASSLASAAVSSGVLHNYQQGLSSGPGIVQRTTVLPNGGQTVEKWNNNLVSPANDGNVSSYSNEILSPARRTYNAKTGAPEGYSGRIVSASYTCGAREGCYIPDSPLSVSASNEQALSNVTGEVLDVGMAVASGGAWMSARGTVLGLRGALNAARSGRELRMPALDNRLAGTNTLGVTMPNGHVFLRPGLSRAEQVATLRHESVHAYLSVRDGAPLASLRQNVGMWGYNNSHLLRFTEEALAEGYAARSLIQGLRHPLYNGYGISVPRLILEAGALGGGIGVLAHLGYQLGIGE